jgi:hypothetical protein
MSSWVSGGSRTLAGTRVEIGTALRAQSSTVLATQTKSGNRKSHFLTHRVAHIQVRRPLRHWVDGRVVQRVGIRTEQRIDLDREWYGYVCQTTPAGGPGPARDGGTPHHFALGRALESALDPNRPVELEVEPGEQRIVGLEDLSGVDGTPPEQLKAYPKHSH